MAWIKLHQTLWEHRKTIMLAAQLGIEDVTAAGHMARLWCWALDNAPSGSLARLPNIVIAKGAGWRGDAELFVTSCMSVGFIDDNGAHLYLHDWHDYAGKLIDKRNAHAETMRKARAEENEITKDSRDTHVILTNESHEENGHARDVPRVEKSREEIKEKNMSFYKDVISYLNQKCKTHYRADTKPTQKHINARVDEGYTLDDFKSVIDKKSAEWLGTKMAEYLRPETLFGSKFESYLNTPGATVSEKDNEPKKYYRASAEESEEVGSVFDQLTGQSG